MLRLDSNAPPPVPRLPAVRTAVPSPIATTGRALMNWGRAVSLDALIVGVLWLAGLEILRVPWAPLWAVVGALCQFIPGIGGMISVVGPVIAAALSSDDDPLFRVCMVLGLYAVIMVLEGLVIAPLILRRTTLVPWWASLLGPVVLGILIPPWGVLLAPPVLAVTFALLRRRKAQEAESRTGR
jgi:predicted PurR-regulated permease PerM